LSDSFRIGPLMAVGSQIQGDGRADRGDGESGRVSWMSDAWAPRSVPRAVGPSAVVPMTTGEPRFSRRVTEFGGPCGGAVPASG
jgi:hypothetical protein